MAEDSSADELYSCLVKWVCKVAIDLLKFIVISCLSYKLEGCLELGGQVTFDPSAVNDGNALAECLLQLVPGFFTSSWRSRIISETGGNWKLKVKQSSITNNLRSIYLCTQHTLS